MGKKVETWPQLLFKRDIDLKNGAGKEFNKLKNIRNKLVHFIADYNDIDMGSIKINKLIDISEYDRLNDEVTNNIPEVVLNFASEIFLLAGCNKESIPLQIQLWFGDLRRVKK